ncbi:DNA-binding protein [Streptomyces sp. CC53]|uniref:PIN domain-containing protein n=1 Tax=unclassified Streptomyces TaxID=2593676 RepID=UPI0008DDCF14|nr:MULTISPECIES: PIN domain-containing protein [unclassified Streptomyces]OII66082.1 DNA-binding protein [Streptomyces sp. CC53]
MRLDAKTVVLDSEGLSAWINQDRKVSAVLRQINKRGAEFVVCANTIVEVVHAGVNVPRLNWALSQVRIEPVTARSAKAAARLLQHVGLHGHKYAIDATVAEAALRQPGPVIMLTSDIDDMSRLCGKGVQLMAL